MAFVSWQVEYQRAKDALASRSWDSYYQSSIENHEKMRTTFTLLGNITQFIEWLRVQASVEASGAEEGGISMCIGGY
jgi:hypothetical protein